MMRIVITCILILCSSHVMGFDFITANGGGLGKAVLLSQPTSGELLNVPIGASTPKTWRFEMGLNRAYDMKELDQVYASGYVRIRSITVAGGYSQFGTSDLYVERLFKGSIAIQMKKVSFGFSNCLQMVSFGGGYSRRSTNGVGASVAWRGPKLSLAILGDNINSPKLNQRSPKIEPSYSLLAEFIRQDSYSLVGRVTAQKKECPQFSIGQRIFMKQTSAVLWGMSTSPFKFGAGLELGLTHACFIYTAQYHPVLGLTHTITISYGSVRKSNRGKDEFR